MMTNPTTTTPKLEQRLKEIENFHKEHMSASSVGDQYWQRIYDLVGYIPFLISALREALATMEEMEIQNKSSKLEIVYLKKWLKEV
jgi:hypothetical protein